MRLIEINTLAMETYHGRGIPPYAILSHTWEDEEVTLQDWNSPTRDGMKGFHKIRKTCQLAASQGIKYVWVDTCCIDKSNSAELSEAINSMYKWYKNADVCCVYLSDLYIPQSEPSTQDLALTPLLRGCRWFSRGWTLQELIAPSFVLFYDHDWRRVGSKISWKDMLSDITGISSNAIFHYNSAHYPIAERMSWAAGRETTREEDKAYCLMGIFDVNMPLLYGEGANAFRRLQEEIIRTGYDVSIFAWTKTFQDAPPYWFDENSYRGAFAEAPGEFHSIPDYMMRRQWNEVSVTNAGVKLTLELCLVRMPQTGRLSYALPVCAGGWQRTGNVVNREQYVPALGVGLKMIGTNRFARKSIERLVEIPENGEAGMVPRIRFPNAYILIDVPYRMLSDLSPNHLNLPHFEFPLGCRVVKAWPSGSWNDAESLFMARNKEPNYGSLLLEIQYPTLSDDGSGRQCHTGEFMFLFSSLPSDNLSIKKPQWDLHYTIVGYREKQLMLDSFNVRMGAGDMDVGEMRQTLTNFGIPRQRTATVPIMATGQYIYTSVDFDSERGYTFRSSAVAFENEKHLWGE